MFSFRSMDQDELIEYIFKVERNAKVLAARMFFLESTIAQAIHKHHVPERVCVCERCQILRSVLRQNLPTDDKEFRDRSRDSDIVLEDKPSE